MKKIKGCIKKTLLSAILSSFLFGGGLVYGKNLEDKVSKPEIDINFKFENEQEGVDYSKSNTIYYYEGFNKGKLWYSPNIFGFENHEIIKVANIIESIQDKKINSYQELIEESKNLSENQKIVLLSAIGGILRDFNYEDSNEKVSSQDTFFEKLQDSLATGEQNGLGVCRHISSHLEQIAEDMEVRSTAVTGFATIGHVYVILKTNEGSSIVDYSEILTTNTKNIEKILGAYQKYQGTTAFQHLFFEDAEFKYRLITRDGEHFLDFVEYDETSQSLKNKLINNISKKDSRELKITLDFEKYLTSFELNYKGIFAKAGEIRGDLSSPLNKINLYQGGYKKESSILDILNINGNLNFVLGLLNQDNKEVENNEIFGAQGSLILTTNNEKGFKFASRISGFDIFLGDMPFFHDFTFGAGLSYKIPIKKIKIEPYVITQYNFFPNDLGTEKYRPKFLELNVGSILDIGIKKTNLSLGPYYTWKIWENEFGGAIEFNSKNARANIAGYITKSKYDFCPDKIGFKTELEAKLKNLDIKAGYEGKKTNYDGEKEWSNSLNASINIKY